MVDCVVLDVIIVSERLKAFLTVRAPGATEFFPVRLQGPRPSEPPAAYWAVNWIRELDVLDTEASSNVDEHGEKFVEVPVVDISRAPKDGVIGLLKGYEVEKIVRSDLRAELEKAGFTGLKFLRLYHSGEEDWVKPGHGSPVRRAPRRSGPGRRRKV